MQYIVIIDVQNLLFNTRQYVLDEFRANGIDPSYLSAWYRWAFNHILHRTFHLPIIGYVESAAFHNVYIQVEKMFHANFLTCFTQQEFARVMPDLTYQTVFTGQELLFVSCKEV